MSDKQTFWMLLDKYKIEIPVIQRDYAQGRETEKATQIRKKFVSHLFKLVSDPSRSDDLDFIYGTAKNGTLVLLDGQQRLTTLFLLHWYLAIENNALEGVQSKLEKFGYKTRITSKDFIDSLIKFGSSFDLCHLDGKLSEKIKDSAWFFSIWLNDPTVKSMLTMLDEIHEVFQPALKEGKDFWVNLTSHDNPPITFYFLNMEDFSLTDELYIKMNARGKPLTEFENFKAWLQSFVSKKTDGLFKGFWHALDKEWTDVFWRVREKGAYEIDVLFLSCFKNLALLNLSKELDSSPKKLADRDHELVGKLRANDYVSVEVYDTKALFSFETLKSIHNFLNIIHFLQTSENKNARRLWLKCESVFKDGLNKEGYLEKARFHAMFLYLSQVDNNTRLSESFLEDFSDWLDVTQRLINNTAYDNSVDFVRSVQAIEHLGFLVGNTLNQLKDIKVEDFKFFNEVQRKEEILKAGLIEESDSWKKIFNKVEGHSYFYGQIGFLIDACFDLEKKEYNQERFIEVAHKISFLFSDDFLSKHEILLYRALLSKGDYLVHRGSNYSFCESIKTRARDRNENWRAVFNNEKKRDMLIDLIDQIHIGDEVQGLKRIISESHCNGWRQHFINHPETIKYCNHRKVRFPYDGKGEIYLLKGERISGRHYGLRSYVLYLLIQSSEDSVLNKLKRSLTYYEASGESDTPGIIIEPYDNGKLDIEYHEYGFVMKYLNQSDEELILDESRSEIKALQAIIHSIMSIEGR